MRLAVRCSSSRTAFAPLAVLLGFAGCASHAAPPGAQPAPMAGFVPGPVPAGYTRFLTPVIDDIGPGEDQTWCQWLTGPLATAEDILGVSGAQSKQGHHVVLYATTDSEPVGTTRTCTTADMLSLRFLGFVGGEGGSTSSGTMPPGVAFRVPAGTSLMANVHFINTQATAIQGQAAIDVERAAPSPSHTMASFFANTTLKLAIEPRQEATFDVTCAVQQDLPFVMAANHMHASGVSAYTEVIHPDGTRQDLARDASWTPDAQYNPAWSRWPVGGPFVVHAGETIHTQCTWDNPGDTQLVFPDEMCAGLGFFLGESAQIQCVDGAWAE